MSHLLSMNANKAFGDFMESAAAEAGTIGAVRTRSVPATFSLPRSVMPKKPLQALWVVLVAGTLLAPLRADDGAGFTHKEDVVYGRKVGTALTMDVFTPKKNANGAGVILVVSGGFFSGHENIRPAFVQPLLDR